MAAVLSCKVHSANFNHSRICDVSPAIQVTTVGEALVEVGAPDGYHPKLTSLNEYKNLSLLKTLHQYMPSCTSTALLDVGHTYGICCVELCIERS